MWISNEIVLEVLHHVRFLLLLFSVSSTHHVILHCFRSLSTADSKGTLMNRLVLVQGSLTSFAFQPLQILVKLLDFLTPDGINKVL